MEQKEQQKESRIKIPKSLEQYLPSFVILYGEPYLLHVKNSNKYDLKFSIPISDYYLNKFKEFYNLKKNPDPNEIFNILKKDIETFTKKLHTCDEIKILNKK